MKYYKWIDSNDQLLTITPGHVYTSIEKAYEHEEPTKNLYSFEGIEPTIIKQKLPSIFLTMKFQTVELSQYDYYKILDYFNNKPYDYLINKHSDIPLMQNLGHHVGCLQTDKLDDAVYLREATLIQENNFIITQSKGSCCISGTLILHAVNWACGGSTSYTLLPSGTDIWTGSGTAWCTGPLINFTFTCVGTGGTLSEDCGGGANTKSSSLNCSGPTYWGPTITGSFSNCCDFGGVDYWITS